MENHYIDINYTGTIKSKFTIDDVYTKIQNYLKRNKNKTWICQQEEKTITIDFHDGVSDEFLLDPDSKNKFGGYCRVSYDETADETTLEKLLNMLFSIKSVFSKIEVDDDYSICESYLKSKEIKIKLLDLSEQDIATVNAIYNEGYKDYREFLLSYIAKTLNLSTYRDLYVTANATTSIRGNTKEEIYEKMIFGIFQTWLYETALYKQKRFYDDEFFNIDNKAEYQALGATAFDMCACCDGIQSIISKSTRKGIPFGLKDAHVQKLYRDKIIDMLNQEESQYEQCIIAYRFLISIMKYTNFEFVGKDESRNKDIHYNQARFPNSVITIVDALKYTLI